MKRRKFLKFCSSVGLGFATPVGHSYFAYGEEEKESAPYEGPYYVVFNASGGWDTTYMMDPKGINGMNRLYKEDEILTEGNHKFAPIAKHCGAGMNNQAFFKKYGKDLLTFNGMDISVNNHSPCSRYVATGKLDSLEYPTFAALAAACKGQEAPLAFLTFGQYSATGNLVAMARAPYMSTIKTLAVADAIHGNPRAPYHDDFVINRIEQALQEQAESRAKQSRLPRVERSQSMLYAAQQNSKALSRLVPHIPKTQSKGRLQGQADITLASFKAGVCVSANLSIGQFDSHNNNDPDQMKLIPEFLGGIDYLLNRAEQLKIRDKLVVIIQSEMGRTPNYNKNDGKDHWSIGSLMFMGAGIKGNRVIGATDEKQFLIPLNPKTLALQKEGGIRVRSEHIHQAMRELAGIDQHEFSEKFPLEIPEEEKLKSFWG
jgi:hypothetical protein